MNLDEILRALKENRITPEEAKKLMNPTTYKDAVAVVGISGKYAKANDIKEYWNILSSGTEAVGEVPSKRWNADKYYDSERGKAGKMYSKWAGIIDDVESFDAMFFGIVPSEAEIMDPQQRMFIEEGYKAFEDAGYCKKTLDGKNCGIYLGVIKSEYDKILENGHSSGTITGGSSAIAASRLSYFLNLKGPAISLDTACSSSLVGVHLAIQALKRKEIEMALVGGTSLYLTPEAFINMCQAGMLSSDGHCKAFDNAADGFIPGEGVAAVVLKRAEDAIMDHDNIYGVIIASGINQDGHTNGITAPSKKSQYQLIHDIYEKYNIDPKSISYAELHGTGTRLGDPIELKALQKVFEEGGCQSNSCAIGSVKSNIGHTTAAAGVAGLEKILLCMKHKKLVPTLNVKKPNEKFNFEQSAFYINQELIPWNAAADKPLRACLSSFGYSGTNAHAVVEEYQTADVQRKVFPYSKEQPGLFLLSAGSEESLKEYARRMTAFLEEETVCFDDVLYTLQIGRDAMKCRIAIVTYGMEDLIEKLNRYLKDGDKQDIYTGKVNAAVNNSDCFKVGSACEQDIRAAANVWIQGRDLDLSAIYSGRTLYRTPLPGYPFEKEKFRIYYENQNNAKEETKINALHPYIHTNTSDFKRQSFQTVFNGSEPILKDHQVGSDRILPGAVTLEMACVAAQLASGKKVGEVSGLSWNMPIVYHNEPIILETILYPEDEGTQFEIVLQKDDCKVPCVEGTILFKENTEQTNERRMVEIDEIIKNAEKTLTKSQFYKEVAGGIHYGESLQTVDALYYDDRHVVSKLSLPANTQAKCSNGCLPPALFDGALQTLFGFAFSEQNDENMQGAFMPCGAEKIKIFSDFSNEGYVYAKKIEKLQGEEIFKLQMLDLQGNVCAVIDGLHVKRANGTVYETVCMTTEWIPYYMKKEEAADEAKDRIRLFLHNCENEYNIQDEDSVLILQGDAYSKTGLHEYTVNTESVSDWEKLFTDADISAYDQVEVIDMWSLIKSQKENSTFRRMFVFAKALMEHKMNASVTLLHFYQEKRAWDDCKEEALYGLFRNIHNENPKFCFRTIGWKGEEIKEEELSQRLREIRLNPQLPLQAKVNGKQWYIKKRIATDIPKTQNAAFKRCGTYLITGGMGKLGLLIAEHLILNWNANVVLVGSRPQNELIDKKLLYLNSKGGSARYIQADMTRKEEVLALAQQVSNINGIIAAAGKANDMLLIKKELNDACSIVDVKIGTSRYLDEAFANADLDFFVLFSSVSAVLGTIGQSDYSYGNSYLDNFAEERNRLAAEGKRKGKTISINWPYWDADGISIDADTLRNLRVSYGIIPLKPAEGLRLFDAALCMEQSQILFMYGDRYCIQNFMESVDTIELNQKQNENTAANEDYAEYKKQVIDYLKRKISKVTKIDVSKIEKDEDFEIYGIDSIVIMSITREIEEDFGVLPKILFFENKNIEELSEYFLKNHKKTIKKLFGKSAEKETHGKEESVYTGKPFTHTRFRRTQYKNAENHLAGNKAVSDDEIAIIGISGKYPMADNLTEFWDNLYNARDCVTEIPKNRWNADEYYSKEKGIPGKCNSKWGGFINDVEMFDPMFFQITPLEAEYMDPQVRLFLETTWHTLEDAGYTRADFQGKKVGVFVGVMYGLYQLVENSVGLTGNVSYASIANRVSYYFDFKGPSIAMDTMCSSSLTSIHAACRSILSGESDAAIAGGVNLILHPNKYVQLSQSNFTSSDGKCRSFGSGGDGYVPGEGAGAVLLKPLKAAVRDGDHIYAVIKASAINAGGKTNGFTVPNPKAQFNVIQDAIVQSGINPRDITCIEAHGTGTSLGDPIEISSITNVFKEFTDKNQYCSIGSVKSNIGHLESAAGMAALTKVLLEMQHKTLVPNIHSEVLNPYIDFVKTPFYVQQSVQEWNPGERPRIAGVSAFGAGGSNAHIILQEYCDEPLANDKPEPRLFVLSARNEERLHKYAEDMLCYLDSLSIDAAETESDESEQRKEEILSVILGILEKITGVSKEVLNQMGTFENIGLNRYDCEQFLQKMEEKLKISLKTDQVYSQHNFKEMVESIIRQNDKGKTATKEKRKAKLPLADLSYTLLVGRETMSHRLAVVASTEEELYRALKDYVLKNENSEVFTGDVDNVKTPFQNIIDDNSFSYYVKNIIEQKNLVKLAECWVLGAKIDWQMLFKNEKRKRVSLPGYPFAKVRCWVVSEKESSVLVLPKRGANNVQNNQSELLKEEVKHTEALTEKTNNADLFEFAVDYLKEAFSAVLKIPKEELLLDTEFERYGIDSIYINNLNLYFEQNFKDIPSSLLFKYKTLRMLANYLVQNQKTRLLEISRGEPANACENDETAVQKTNEALKEVNNEAITDERSVAIIGISGKYPMAHNLNEFSKNLEEGRDCITEIPKERWNYEDYPDVKCKWGGFIDDIDKFDPQFFGIAPMNALYMDPQERIFLEKVWECLEDAGYTPKMLEDESDFDSRGNVSVFAGVSFNTYCLSAASELQKGIRLPVNSQIYSVANRVSYTLNLSGESLSVDTACSSSLYALYLGCKSLWDGESEMSIAGGVNLSLHPSKYVELNLSSFLASDGHCHSFGIGGDGYVPGEGAGVVLLKPLQKAKQDHDHIYGVIKGISANHGGKTHGYTVPNPIAQTQVVKKALKMAGVNPRTISYLEAHGTGTALGDPIEVDALNDAYHEYTDDKGYCPIGSVKSNIGHLEAAAGISQLTKVLLQMQKKKIFPSRLNSEQINPNVKFKYSPFYLAQKVNEWKKPVVNGTEYPRRAGISSFGVGGVNVHVIIEEYNNVLSESKKKKLCIVPISAKSEEALQKYAEAYYGWTQDILKSAKQGEDTPAWEDFAYTIQTGRLPCTYRAAFVVDGYAQLARALQQYLDGEINNYPVVSGRANPAFAETKAESELYSEENGSCLFALAKAWVEGYYIEFDKFHTGNEYRVSAPTYPFARERYWMYDLLETKEEKHEEDVTENEVVTASEDTVNAGQAEDTADATDVSDSMQDEKFSDIEFLEEYYSLLDSEKMDYVLEYLQHLFAELLLFPDGKLPETDQGFFDLGLESLTSNTILEQLQKLFGMELDVQIFFNYPNITKLTEYLIPLIDENEDVFREYMEGRENSFATTVTVQDKEDDKAAVLKKQEDTLETGNAFSRSEQSADESAEKEELEDFTTDELAKMLEEEMNI